MTKNKTPFLDEILNLSLAVSFGECLEDFVELYLVNRHWINEQKIIFKNIRHFKSTTTVPLEYMEDLVNALCTPSIKKAFLKRKEAYVKIPLKDWMTTLHEARVDSYVLDVGPVPDYLGVLKEAFCEDAIDATDIR